MQTININGREIKVYKNADEMPVKRYSRFQKYNVLESGVGATIEAVGEHYSRLFEYLTYNMKEEALQEAKNLYYNYYMILEELNIPGLAFACLVYSIDGVEVTDISEDNLKNVVDILSGAGVTQKTVNEINGEIKKKIHRELKMYAPAFFAEDDKLQFFERVKNKIQAIQKTIETGDNAALFELDRYFAEYTRPGNFDSDNAENAVLQIDTNFENLCAVLESNGVHEPGNLTVMQFYLRLDYFRRVNTKHKKAPENSEA